MELVEYYDQIIERCNETENARPDGLSHNDRIIFYVISVRCEIDINGLESVFDQLLSERELSFLIDALNELENPGLAKIFSEAHTRLKESGFYTDTEKSVSDLTPESESGLLDDLEERLQKNDELWELDEKLSSMMPK